jgi:hypothetical protein
MSLSMSLILLVSFITFSCRKHTPPKAELCGYHEETKVVTCNDPRRTPESYDRLLKNGDLCSAPESFERVKSYCGELRSKLIKCERRLR